MAEVHARDMFAAAIGRIRQFAEADDFPNRLMREIRTRISNLHHSWEQFQGVHLELLQIVQEQEQRAPHLQVYQETEENWYAADAIMQERINAVDNDRDARYSEQSQNDHRSSVNENGSQNGRQVDEISQVPHNNPQQFGMPPAPQVGQFVNPTPGNAQWQWPWQFRIENTWGEFDGDFMKWPAFHDSFKNRIYEDAFMQPVQKFQILKAALKGKAAKALGEWIICNRNFEPAWKRLTELYDDQYKTSRELLHKLFNLKKLESPNGARLQVMSNVVQEVARQLGAMNYPSEHFDVIFVHAVHDKLDPQTAIAWDKKRESARPTLEALTQFLDREARALTNVHEPEQKSNGRESYNHKRNNNWNTHKGATKHFKSNSHKEAKTAVKPEGVSCAVCNEPHKTRTCDKFLRLNLTKRKEKVRNGQLCFNCLGAAHSAKDCRSGKCNRCDKKHNSLLCPENPLNRDVNTGQMKSKESKGGSNRRKQYQKKQSKS